MNVLIVGKFKELKLESLKEKLANQDIFMSQNIAINTSDGPKLQDLILIEETITGEVDWPSWIGVKIIMTDSQIPEKRIAFLKAGAFALWPRTILQEELYYRLKNIHTFIVKDEKTMVKVKDEIMITIDKIHKQVFINDEEIVFTPSEYVIFSQLATNHKRVYSRDDLIQLVKGAGFSTTLRTIDTHIKNIRKKTEKDPQHPEIIQTVHGHGYRIN